MLPSLAFTADIDNSFETISRLCKCVLRKWQRFHFWKDRHTQVRSHVPDHLQYLHLEILESLKLEERTN